MLLLRPDLRFWSPWYFEDFRDIFLPNTDEDKKKDLPSERGAQALCYVVNPAIVSALCS